MVRPTTSPVPLVEVVAVITTPGFPRLAWVVVVVAAAPAPIAVGAACVTPVVLGPNLVRAPVPRATVLLDRRPRRAAPWPGPLLVLPPLMIRQRHVEGRERWDRRLAAVHRSPISGEPPHLWIRQLLSRGTSTSRVNNRNSSVVIDPFKMYIRAVPDSPLKVFRGCLGNKDVGDVILGAVREDQPHLLRDFARIRRPRPQVNGSCVIRVQQVGLDALQGALAADKPLDDLWPPSVDRPSRHKRTLKNIAAPSAAARLLQGLTLTVTPWCLRQLILQASSAWRRCANLMRNGSGWCRETVTSPRCRHISSRTTASISRTPVVAGARIAITTTAELSHSNTSCSRSKEVGTKKVSSSGLVLGSPNFAITAVGEGRCGGGRLVVRRHGGGGGMVGRWVARGGGGGTLTGLLGRSQRAAMCPDRPHLKHFTGSLQSLARWEVARQMKQRPSVRFLNSRKAGEMEAGGGPLSLECAAPGAPCLREWGSCLLSGERGRALECCSFLHQNGGLALVHPGSGDRSI
ncbi:hypothetical protein C2845_PM16G17670 [Panicum miliaceum]|uniref:Uncharacterized protein n=1 Tax=Panicum miliaceum TaxID=4540 RepID=A0A3L6PZC2_PANMI|nr:hypothetical protein C2845_PM16G17670 [Panicum miliaceum]